MEFINEKDKRYNNLLNYLISDLYKDYDYVVKKKRLEFSKLQDKDNPFFYFARAENFLLLDNGKAVAHVSVILDNRLDANIGLLGYFESVNDDNYAFSILDKAKEFLTAKDINIALGPINLNILNSFRFSYPEENKPFLSEPFSRQYYTDIFESYGFSLAQKNFTTISSVDETNFDKFEGDFNQVLEKGYKFYFLNNSNFDTILEDVYKIVNDVFSESLTFVNISLEEFKYFLKDLNISMVNSSCFLKDDKDNTVAFCFSFKDIYNTSNNNLVIKTFVVDKKYQGQGLGKALFYFVYQQAVKNKVDNFIFSTMREDNLSILNLTSSDNVYRNYNVYQLKI